MDVPFALAFWRAQSHISDLSETAQRAFMGMFAEAGVGCIATRRTEHVCSDTGLTFEQLRGGLLEAIDHGAIDRVSITEEEVEVHISQKESTNSKKKARSDG